MKKLFIIASLIRMTLNAAHAQKLEAKSMDESAWLKLMDTINAKLVR